MTAPSEPSAQEYRDFAFIVHREADTLWESGKNLEHREERAREADDFKFRSTNLHRCGSLLAHAATLHAALEERTAQHDRLLAAFDARGAEVTTLREARDKLTEALTVCLRERNEAYASNERLTKRLDDWSEREASCCPEDVGFDEVIRRERYLNAQLLRERDDAQAAAKRAHEDALADWNRAECLDIELKEAERSITAVRAYCESILKGICGATAKRVLALLPEPASNQRTEALAAQQTFGDTADIIAELRERAEFAERQLAEAQRANADWLTSYNHELQAVNEATARAEAAERQLAEAQTAFEHFMTDCARAYHCGHLSTVEIIAIVGRLSGTEMRLAAAERQIAALVERLRPGLTLIRMCKNRREGQPCSWCDAKLDHLLTLLPPALGSPEETPTDHDARVRQEIRDVIRSWEMTPEELAAINDPPNLKPAPGRARDEETPAVCWNCQGTGTLDIGQGENDSTIRVPPYPCPVCNGPRGCACDTCREVRAYCESKRDMASSELGDVLALLTPKERP